MDESSHRELEIKIKLLESQVQQLIEIPRQSHSNKLGKISAKIYIPVWVALITLIGSVTGYLVNSKTTSNLAESEFKSGLILKAIETVDRNEAAERLKFLVNAKLIEDKDNAIMELAGKPHELPILSETYIQKSRSRLVNE